MTVEVHEIGRSKAKVIVIDDFLTDAQGAVNAAVALAPYPPEDKTGYPGRRYQIGPGDKASTYVMDILRTAGPLIQHHFDADSFRVFEASFSLVTTPPESLSPRQRIPHYDSEDPNYLAILLHLHHLPETGTAFFRHVASDLEFARQETTSELRKLVQSELAECKPTPASSGGLSNAHYEKIFQVEGAYNRLVIYQGSLLHSGYFPDGFNYSGDPAIGRLTANVFIQITKSGG